MPNAKPIPDGFRTITPQLMTRNASQAIDFYKKAFGAEERVRFPGPDGKIMYAEVKIGDSILMLGEENPSHPEKKSPLGYGGTPVALALYVEDVDKLFDRAVKAGAKVVMPLADMVWGDRHGQESEPSGHVWSLATHKRDVPPDEMAKAAAAEFAKHRK